LKKKVANTIATIDFFFFFLFYGQNHFTYTIINHISNSAFRGPMDHSTGRSGLSGEVWICIGVCACVWGTALKKQKKGGTKGFKRLQRSSMAHQRPSPMLHVCFFRYLRFTIKVKVFSARKKYPPTDPDNIKKKDSRITLNPS